MRRLSLVVALAATLLVAMALPAGADPQENPNNSATEILLDCGEGNLPILVMFATSSAVAFDPGADNGRKYAMLSLEGAGFDSGGDLLYEYMHVWGARNGYRGEVLDCSGSVTYSVPDFGDVTESFEVTLQSK